MAKVSDQDANRLLTRIVVSDREENAAAVVSSALDTLAADLTRFRSGDRRKMTRLLSTYRPDVTIPPPAEYFDGGDPPIRAFLDEVERAAHQLIAQLAGQLGPDDPDPEGASWWRCRWCGRVDIRAGRPLDHEQAECLAHEAACDRRPK